LHNFHSALDLVRERSPERPVALVRPDAVALAGSWFQQNFKGEVLYAVKANPSPWVIETLRDTGSRPTTLPRSGDRARSFGRADAKLAFMHPVKSRRAITSAYFDHGVRTFALDTHESWTRSWTPPGAPRT
jgi:ornithine decarboxylase